jgi:two-component system, OmpR family, response regulator
VQANSANAKILIVEDDPEIGKLLALAIQENGMVATVAEDGHVMNALLRNNEFDLIILDVMLPGERWSEHLPAHPLGKDDADHSFDRAR